MAELRNADDTRLTYVDPVDAARDRAGQKTISDSVLMRGVDFKHYGNDFATDAEGRVTLANLIPGTLYRISDFSTNRALGKGVQIRTDFTVKPGETLDLGDILIEKPPG